MRQTIINEFNVLLFLLMHIKKARAYAGEPTIITANPEIWNNAIFALKQRCISTLLHTFNFQRVGLKFFCQSLEQIFDQISAAGLISRVEVEYDGYKTIAFILRDELTEAIQVVRVDSPKNKFAYFASDITEDLAISTDYEAMVAETRELAEQLLPLIDERVENEIKTKRSKN
jgi:hypothetical protein